jgi:large subunit ribosomal protein L30
MWPFLGWRLVARIIGLALAPSHRRKGAPVTGKITVTQVKSGIGAKPKTRGTLRALGLGRIGKSNTLPDRPDVRGMIARVPHLVRVEEKGDG